MSKFVHVDFSPTHSGVERVENAVSFLSTRALRWNSSRTLSTVVLIALVAAVLVMTNQAIDTMTDGHAFAAWMGMWALGFAMMALLKNPVFAVVRSVSKAYARWQQVQHLAQQDAQLWELANRDSRIMSDIKAAASFSSRK